MSYRFNSRVKFLAPELSRFLTLLDIKVVSGVGYERRRVARKVSGRPKSGYDFFIYLITQDDEGAWTKDELALACGEVVPVIILVEKGSKTGKEILGDHEYIEFDGNHIGDTFYCHSGSNKFHEGSERTGSRPTIRFAGGLNSNR